MNNIFIVTEDNRLGKPSAIRFQAGYGIGKDGKVEMETWAKKENKTGNWNKLRVMSLEEWPNKAGAEWIMKSWGLESVSNN